MSMPPKLSALLSVLVTGFALAFLGGCQGAPDAPSGDVVSRAAASRGGGLRGPFPGSTFQQQIEELGWSAGVIFEMDYTGKLAFDDFVQMFIGDEKELSGHHLAESFEMLGW